jgi:hypothetical protein
MGYKYIQWSVDSIDWQEPNADTIVKRVVGGTKSGSILLFHNDLENTTEALPQVITRLKEKGFDFSTVSELIYRENYKIDHTGKQIFDAGAADVDALIHTAGTQANAAFEILLQNLTIDEIMSLENGISPDLTRKLSKVLSREQINAVSALSDDELQSAWATLVEAKITGSVSVLERIENGNLTPEELEAIMEEYGDEYAKFLPDDEVAGAVNTQTPPVTTAAPAVTDVTAAPAVTTAPAVTEVTASETAELPLIENKH